jgi:ubiquinone/menaquinone biosynthesis C-methylase UbiE
MEKVGGGVCYPGASEANVLEDNRVVVEAWNTVLFDKFVRFQRVLLAGLSKHSEALFADEPPRKGARVLDVGCGFGDTTLRLAGLVGPSGSAVGVDCAQNFIDHAHAEAEKSGATNAAFFAADVQTDDLRGPYDQVFARFGTMFFNMPGAALRNLYRALRPGGTLSMIVWRKREDNPWLHDAELCVRAIVPVVAHEDTDQVHCGPGPFSMAGPDMVSDMLRGAGFTHISFERFDTDIDIGRDLDEAVQFALELGPAGEIVRLAGEEGERLRPQVLEALRDALRVHVREDGVLAPSSAWFVRAQKPA